jgi:hypothetical protein
MQAKTQANERSPIMSITVPYVVESRRPTEHGWSDWRADEVGENLPRSLSECEDDCRQLSQLGHEWAEAEYRVVEVQS